MSQKIEVTVTAAESPKDRVARAMRRVGLALEAYRLLCRLGASGMTPDDRGGLLIRVHDRWERRHAALPTVTQTLIVHNYVNIGIDVVTKKSSLPAVMKQQADELGMIW